MLDQKKIEKDYSRWERKDNLTGYHPKRVISSVSVMYYIEIIDMPDLIYHSKAYNEENKTLLKNARDKYS